MLPEEIYAGSASSSNFRYSHPLSHMPVDDGSLRARLAYDLMTFMQRSDCPYFIHPDRMSNYDPHDSDDEIDILIVDGFYKEALHMVEQRLSDKPDCDKSLFQRAFIEHLKQEYQKLLDREETLLLRDPRNVNALLNKGFALANLGREEEALVATNAVLRIDPDNLMALGNKAYIAKSLGHDELRESTLAHAYNVNARRRMKALEQEESRLLRDFNSVFVDIESPSAFEEFNRRSGVVDTVH